MKTIVGYQKGINLGGWLSQCIHTPLHYNSFIKEEDIQRIASWGLDHVRVPVDYYLVETKDGTYKEKGFAYIERCLDWCEKYSLNMILDLHKTAGYAFDDQDSSHGFFEEKALQDRFINLWMQFAERFGKYENRLIFELLNEIVSIDRAEDWNRIAHETITAIRSICPSIKILVGGVCYNSIGALKLLDPPYDENIIYNFHCYEPFLFTHQSAPWVKNMPSLFHLEYPVLRNDVYQHSNIPKEMLGMFFEHQDLTLLDINYFEILFSEAVAISNERNVPLYCGEYGVIDRAPLDSTVNWYRDIHTVFEKYGIGRAAWTYKKKDFGITQKHYQEALDTIIQYL